MKKAILLFVLLAAAITAAFIYWTLIKPAPRAADLLPESTLVFVDIPEFSKLRVDFTKTELYALCQEPEVRAFLEKPLATLREASSSVGVSKDAGGIVNLVLNAVQ